MGKNIKGGKKTKSMGRFRAPSTFRPADQEGELYAIVEKILGNGAVNVKCIDARVRRCIIRKKFIGKGQVVPGTWVLVGLRSYETLDTTCDLLELYSGSDMKRLELLDYPWHVFGVKQEEEAVDDLIDFGEIPNNIVPTQTVKMDILDEDEFNDI